MDEQTRQVLIIEIGTLVVTNAELTTVNKISVAELDKAKQNVARLTAFDTLRVGGLRGLTGAAAQIRQLARLVRSSTRDRRSRQLPLVSGGFSFWNLRCRQRWRTSRRQRWRTFGRAALWSAQPPQRPPHQPERSPQASSPDKSSHASPKDPFSADSSWRAVKKANIVIMPHSSSPNSCGGPVTISPLAVATRRPRPQRSATGFPDKLAGSHTRSSRKPHSSRTRRAFGARSRRWKRRESTSWPYFCCSVSVHVW
jgi:hypothetical protein